MTAPKHQEIHQLGIKAVKAGREVLLHYFGRLAKIQDKHLQGLVSEADVESEKAICKVLKDYNADIDILGEEQSFIDNIDPNQSMRPGRRWILDPLDGTTNYIHQFFAYSISLGLEWDGQMHYGIVDLPALNTTYSAGRGQGAFKNEDKIKVSSRKTIGEALVATGFASSNPGIIDEQLEIFSRLVRKVRGVRRAGSAAIDLCLVAEGVFDAYWEKNLKAWDTAAGGLIVQEAGGVVSDYSSAQFNPYQQSILATNSVLHQSFLAEINSTKKP